MYGKNCYRRNLFTLAVLCKVQEYLYAACASAKLNAKQSEVVNKI